MAYTPWTIDTEAKTDPLSDRHIAFALDCSAFALSIAAFALSRAASAFAKRAFAKQNADA